MNDILLSSKRGPARRGGRLGKMVWSLAGTLSLNGLYVGRICPTWIRFTRMEMPLPDLDPALEGKRLVHVSDLHCSPIVLERYLVQCVELVNALEPDYVAITGDLITGSSHYARRLAEILRRLQVRGATFACLGNHDYGMFHPRGRARPMRKLADYLTERLEGVGVTVLRNRAFRCGRSGLELQFVGLEDLWSGLYDPGAAFRYIRFDRPVVCLSHNPDTAPDLVERGAHWVLSGHTHGNAKGEMPIVDHVCPVVHEQFVGGHYELPTGHLYVNRGLSYARRSTVNKRPEITVFTLRAAARREPSSRRSTGRDALPVASA